MKKSFMLLFAVMVSVLWTGCEKKDRDGEILVKDNMSEIVFVSGDESPKTLTFYSNMEWSASFREGTWLTVEPASGEKGEHKVTISLKDGLSETERVDWIVLKAGNAEKSMKITQQATAVEKGIEIVAPQRRIKAGGEMVLEAKNAEGLVSNGVWTSSDPAVATISASGKLEALTVGKTMISVATEDLKDELEIEVTEEFMTDGLGRTYTFEDLSHLATSGVEYEQDRALLTTSLIIAESDVIALGNVQQVVFGAGVKLFIEGTSELKTTEAIAFTRADGAEKNGQIHFTGKVDGGGNICGISFNGISIRTFGGKPVVIDHCRFTGVVGSDPAVSLGTEAGVTVTDCEFIENSDCAIAGAANIASPLVFENNVLINNSKDAYNRPQINLTAAGKGDIIVRNNQVTGPAEITMNGGIGVSNMMNLPGTNKVVIEGNEVKDCRFGVSIMGALDVQLLHNVLRDNRYEANPMNGGSGVSIYYYGGKPKVYMRGNTIAGHFWGVTNITMEAGVGPDLDMGTLDDPGENVFEDNVNEADGIPYDLYNNCPITVYAQGNHWNVEVQDEESIEEVIFHKKDNPSLGEVIFMPAAK